MKRYLIGAGGHATVLHDIAKKSGIEINGVFVDSGAKNITTLQVVDTIDNIVNYPEDEFILAFGNLKVRENLIRVLTSKGTHWFSLIDPSAVICDDVKIGVGVAIMPGSIINSGAEIHDHAIINSGAIVEHGCVVGEGVHMSPRSVVCGNTKIGNHSWICAGATIIDGLTIGSNSIVGAGAVVTHDVADNQKVVGNPAHEKSKVLKP